MRFFNFQGKRLLKIIPGSTKVRVASFSTMANNESVPQTSFGCMEFGRQTDPNQVSNDSWQKPSSL